MTLLWLSAFLPALAQTGAPTPAIQIELSQPVDPMTLREVRFSQHGRDLGGWAEQDPSTHLLVYHLSGPLDPDAPFAWELPAEIEVDMPWYGPIFTDDDPWILPPCDYSVDTDVDGLPDCGELPGTWYWGEPLHSYGAAVGPRDIFVRVGFVKPEDGAAWTRPEPKALDKVREAFALASGAQDDPGYAVHFDVGNLYSRPEYQGTEWEGSFDLSGNDHGFATPTVSLPFPANQCSPDYSCGDATFSQGWLNGDSGFYWTHRRALISPQNRVWYFVMFAENGVGATGKATNGGASAIVTVNNGSQVFQPGVDAWSPADDDEVWNKIVNYQSGTLMHEMGHMFGLREGGHDTIEGKPNYFSVMSYAYQTTGLPASQAGFVARFHNYNNFKKFGLDKDVCPEVIPADLGNGPLVHPDQFAIGYSSDGTSVLQEDDLDEIAGFYLGATMDWDCDGDATDPSAEFDLTGRYLVDSGDPDVCWTGGPASSTQTIESHDDWANLELYHVKWFGQPIPNDGLPFPCPLAL